MRRFRTPPVLGFDQSNISNKNVRRLRWLAENGNPDVRELASITLDIAKAHSRRKRRFKVIRAQHPRLWERMVAAGIAWECEPEEPDRKTENGDHNKQLDAKWIHSIF